jgi:predicted enzyme related to lactoylglutathione lyase
MFMRRLRLAAALLLGLTPFTSTMGAQQSGTSSAVQIAVAPQYDTTHVYVAPDQVDHFVTAFLGVFGGKSTKQVVATVTPTPISTTSQLLQTPVGTVSLFGFKTPIPAPFGGERTGYLVMDLDTALKAARDAGADVIVAPFPDPIGRDAVICFPGGVATQIYWHTTAPSYAAFTTIPENRVYVSADRADTFLRSLLSFSGGHIVSDDPAAPGVEIGRPGETFRCIRVESTFGKLVAWVTDGHMVYPYGRETTGYEVANLTATLEKAKVLGVKIVIPPYASHGRVAAMVEFPGGYLAEIHSLEKSSSQ